MNDNPCVECKYHKFFNMDAYSDHVCYHLKIRTSYFDPVLGKQFTRVTCSQARRMKNCCEGGRYFEPKEKNFLARWYRWLTT